MATPTQFSAWLESMPDRLSDSLGRQLPISGIQLMSRIQANASGRPGPNTPTGEYRRSWNMRPIPGQLAVVVGTNQPQGRRLEYGFTGTDSLGRNYNQPPYPHVGPAILSEQPSILNDLTRAVIAANQTGIT